MSISHGTSMTDSIVTFQFIHNRKYLCCARSFSTSMCSDAEGLHGNADPYYHLTLLYSDSCQIFQVSTLGHYTGSANTF